jgi:hypothetical protein
VESVPTEQERIEMLKCAGSAEYFIHHYCRIYNATTGEWVPFGLWPAQFETLEVIDASRLVIALKARQLGLSWLVLGYALWRMIYCAAATVLLFSRRDEEAIHLLSDRLTGMYNRLPGYLRYDLDQRRPLESVESNQHEWQLSNGSVARAFPTSAGDSYTASLAIVDEADLVPDLGRLMGAVKPTIDGGGRMILLSRSDKSEPDSYFKRLYLAAKRGENAWAPVFLPWYVRPERDDAWYEEQKQHSLSATGSLDDLFEQYPATDTEAIAPRSLDKRIPAVWLEQCYQPPHEGIAADGMPAVPGLTVFKAPVRGRLYVGGADPAEGNPTSDDSAATFMDRSTGEEVALLRGKFEPDTFASYIGEAGEWFNRADVLVERNNHGHAVLSNLKRENRVGVIDGRDEKPGWLTTGAGKAALYVIAAEAYRDGDTILHSQSSYMQLASIEGATLNAPKGQHDDLAVSNALALAARTLPRPKRLAGALGSALAGAGVKGWSK